MGVAAFICSHSYFVYGHIKKILEATGQKVYTDVRQSKSGGKGRRRKLLVFI